jgi:precorrin-4/cobalt-precorrin-4 C11-methyltransferase
MKYDFLCQSRVCFKFGFGNLILKITGRRKMVHFVGAGSGAVDLITLRGKRLLEEADVVIYAGSLVNPKLLKFTKDGCQVYNSAYMTLDEVIEVIKEAEESGIMTVRLHTGDPSVYGAVREQMDRLNKLGIDYQVCPGVSSFCGAAAALKAEYTLPGVSQSVIITRMAGRTPVREKERMRDLAAHQATMVIFLSMGLLKELTQELLAGGYKENTPAAIVYKATWPEELVLRCTVGTLEETAKQYGITKTALITVGEFLGNEYELSKLYDDKFTTEFRQGKN